MTAIENLSGALAQEAFPGEVVTRAIVRDVDLGTGRSEEHTSELQSPC